MIKKKRDSPGLFGVMSATTNNCSWRRGQETAHKPRRRLTLIAFPFQLPPPTFCLTPPPLLFLALSSFSCSNTGGTAHQLLECNQRHVNMLAKFTQAIYRACWPKQCQQGLLLPYSIHLVNHYWSHQCPSYMSVMRHRQGGRLLLCNSDSN